MSLKHKTELSHGHKNVFTKCVSSEIQVGGHHRPTFDICCSWDWGGVGNEDALRVEIIDRNVLLENIFIVKLF